MAKCKVLTGSALKGLIADVKQLIAFNFMTNTCYCYYVFILFIFIYLFI